MYASRSGWRVGNTRVGNTRVGNTRVGNTRVWLTPGTYRVAG